MRYFFVNYPLKNTKSNLISGGYSDITDSTLPGATITTEYDTGWALGGALGYDFNRFRVEGEISYQKNDVDKIGASKIVERLVNPNVNRINSIKNEQIEFIKKIIA